MVSSTGIRIRVPFLILRFLHHNSRRVTSLLRGIITKLMGSMDKIEKIIELGPELEVNETWYRIPTRF